MSGLALARATVEAFQPTLPEHAAARERMLAFIDEHPDALERSCEEGHLTASTIVLDAARARVLLMDHRKLGKWLQMGGHADGEGDLAAVALSEAEDESGITGLALLAGPVDLDVHLIEGVDGEQAHLHLDVRYAAVAPPGAVAAGNAESREVRWFTLDELVSLETDDSTRRLARLGRLALG